MPQRTTPFQMVIHFVRQHFANADVTVTESKMLTDRVTGIETEVDIVVEGTLDGDPVMIGIEVNEQGRKSGSQWVRSMIAKHGALPTTLLILISEAGFYRPALKIVAQHEGKVLAFQPETVLVGGSPAIKRLYVDSINMHPTMFEFVVQAPGGTRTTVQGQNDIFIYSRDGQIIAPAGFLVNEAMNLPALGKLLGIDAHLHPEREKLKGFTCAIPIGPAGYFLQWLETGELHQISMLLVAGDFAWSQDEVALTNFALGQRRYAATTEGTFLGRPTVWVGTDHPESKISKLSWRTADQQPLIENPPRATNYFPGLLKLDLKTEAASLP